MDNYLLNVSVNSPEYKIEERVVLDLSHARIYLSEPDYERDDKSDDTNTFDIYCGGGGSSSSLSAITVSVLATSNVVCCSIFTPDRFLPNDPLSIDDMVG